MRDERTLEELIAAEMAECGDGNDFARGLRNVVLIGLVLFLIAGACWHFS